MSAEPSRLSARDTECTLMYAPRRALSRPILGAGMNEFGLVDAYQLLHDGALALGRAERQGIRLDVDLCHEKINQVTKSIRRLNRKFEESELVEAWQKEFGDKTNYDSGPQLATVLYDVYKLKPAKLTGSGRGSVDETTLRQYNVDGVEFMLQMRKLTKIKDTYLTAYLREAVLHEGLGWLIHPFFALHTVATYRSSSNKPNFQNVPKRDKEAMQICRSVLFALLGRRLVEIDFSGLEVAIAACYHKDPVMLQYLNDPSSDMHADQAYILFKLDPFADLIKEKGGFKSVPEFWPLRQAAKNGFVFPEFYGDYYVSCAEALACNWGKLPSGKWSKKEGIQLPGGITLGEHLMGQGFRSLDKYTDHVKDAEDDLWERRFKVYGNWRKRWFEDYQESGYFDMYTGFRCQGVMRRNEAVNYPVQGAAFHCLLWTLIETDKVMQAEGWKSRVLGEVHDSMILDVDPDEFDHVIATVQEIACEKLAKNWPWIITPLEVEVEASDVDAPWAELKAVA